MRSAVILVLALACAAVTLPDSGQAYFGPGAGVTMLGALWGVLLAIGFAIFSFLAWPIRAVLRRRKRAANPDGAVPAAARDGRA